MVFLCGGMVCTKKNVWKENTACACIEMAPRSSLSAVLTQYPFPYSVQHVSEVFNYSQYMRKDKKKGVPRPLHGT